MPSYRHQTISSPANHGAVPQNLFVLDSSLPHSSSTYLDYCAPRTGSMGDTPTPSPDPPSPTQTRTVSLHITGSSIANPDDDPYEAFERAKAFLAGVESDIDLLQSEKQEAIRVMKEQERILGENCKVQRLHDDILFLVFYLLVQDYAMGPSQSGRTIWVLSGVCKRWRGVCLEHPSLWRHISLAPSDEHHNCSDNRRDSAAVLRTLAHLERSRGVPLVVNACRLCDCTSAVSMFRAVAAHCHRWEVVAFRKITLQLNNNDLPLEFLSKLFPLDSQFPGLRRLEWDVVNSYPQVSLPIFMNVDSLVNLKSFVVTTTTYTHNFRFGADLPWKRLSHLALFDYDGDPHTLITALCNCQNLVLLRIFAIEPSHPYLPPNNLTLPQLTELEYSTLASQPSFYLLKSLHLPSLRRATFNRLDSEDSIQSAEDLIGRSSSSSLLTSLHFAFRIDRDNSSKLVKILQLCPALQEFAVLHRFSQSTTTSTRNSLMQALAIKADPQEALLCPRLKDLKLDEVNADPAILIQLVDSRIGPDDVIEGHLQKLEWTLPQIFRSEEDTRTLEYCRELFKHKYGSNRGFRYHLGLTRKWPT